MWSPRSKSASTVDVVTVLLLPRIQEHPVIIVSSSRKRKLPSRPPPRRVDRHMIEVAHADGSKIYSEKQFYNGLLVAMFKGSDVKRSKPLYTELLPFSEAGLDVRPWKRYLAQDSLRFGDRVIVHGGPYHGTVGALHTCWPGRADIITIGDESEDHPTVLQVDMRSLDRHFLVGDNVRTIPKYTGDTVRYGQVVNVAEVTLPELTQRRKVMKRAFRRLALDDIKRRKDLREEMRRMKRDIWRQSRRIQGDSAANDVNDDLQPNMDVSGSESESDDIIQHSPPHIAPMYDYSFFGVRYVEITIFDAIDRTSVSKVSEVPIAKSSLLKVRGKSYQT